jgi:hypothetical protein
MLVETLGSPDADTSYLNDRKIDNIYTINEAGNHGWQ